MAETAETTFDEFKGNDWVFWADWFKTKGLHKLCSIFQGVKQKFIFIIYKCVLSNKSCLHAQFQKLNRSY